MNYLQALHNIWSNIDLERYTTQVLKRYGVLNLSSLALQEQDNNIPILLTEIFIEPFVTHAKTIEPVLKALSKKNYKRILILGHSGSGKSTLTRYLLLSLLNPPTNATGQIPAWLETFTGHLPRLIELCYDMNHDINFWESCHDFRDCTPNHLELKEQFKTRPSLVIFDGLNDIVDPSKRQKVMREIIHFARKYTNTRIVVTSCLTHLKGNAFQRANFKQYTLQDFSPEQIKTLTQSWFRRIFAPEPNKAAFRSQQIISALQHTVAIRQLATNPLIGTMIVNLANFQELPNKRAKVYEQTIKVLCLHMQVDCYKETLGLSLKKYKLALLHRIAMRMLSIQQGLKNMILKKDLQNEIKEHIQTYWPNLSIKQVTTLTHAIIHQLSEHNRILCQYNDQWYGFVHHTFLEYLIASEIVNRFRPCIQLTPNELKIEVFLAHYQDETWYEVLKFICGMVSPLLAGELINAIVPARKKAFTKTKELVLAVQCLAEVTQLNLIAESAQCVLEGLRGWFEQTKTGCFDENCWKEALFYQYAIPAIEKIGKNWPRRKDCLDDWVLLPNKIIPTILGAYAFGKMVAALWGDDERIKEMLMISSRETTEEMWLCMIFDALARCFKNLPEIHILLQQVIMSNQHENRRNAAIESLAKHYTHAPNTLQQLMQIALFDPNDSVRYGLLYVLAKYYTDSPGLLPLFRQFATDKQEDSNVRRAALDILAEYYTEVPNTLPLLIQITTNNQENCFVREAAISGLTQHYADVPETLPLLLQFIKDEQDEDVCSDLLNDLVRYHTDAPETLLLLRQFATDNQKTEVCCTAIGALAEHYADQVDILSWLQYLATNAQETEVRNTAIMTLAEYYTDIPSILPRLQQFATSDQETEIRCTAISALATYYNSIPSIFFMLRQFVTNDPESKIRCEAIKALAKHYDDNSDILPWLQHFAMNGQETEVRNAALWTLTEHYRDADEILSLLKQLVISEQDSDVHGTAVIILAERYSYVPEIYRLLQQLVLSESDSDIRCAIVWSLAQYYTNASETLLLLKQLAMNDQEDDVRSAAVGVLAWYYIDTPDILSGLRQIITSDKDANVRQTALGGIIRNYDKTWRKLLSQKLDGDWPWLDPNELIDEKRINQAADKLTLPFEIICQYYEAIALEIPLQLSWDHKKLSTK